MNATFYDKSKVPVKAAWKRLDRSVPISAQCKGLDVREGGHIVHWVNTDYETHRETNPTLIHNPNVFSPHSHQLLPFTFIQGQLISNLYIFMM